MTADIRIGDVWKSVKDDSLVTTREVSRDGVWFRGAAAPDTCATPANFMRGRALWERNGLRIGDARTHSDGSTTKILVLRDDVAVCDDADGIRTYPAAEIAALPLVSRDGESVSEELNAGAAAMTAMRKARGLES